MGPLTFDEINFFTVVPRFPDGSEVQESNFQEPTIVMVSVHTTTLSLSSGILSSITLKQLSDITVDIFRARVPINPGDSPLKYRVVGVVGLLSQGTLSSAAYDRWLRRGALPTF